MAQLYDPKGEIACNPPPAGTDPRRCLPLFGSFFGGDATNDVLQYYLGGYVAVANDGHVGGTAFDSIGVDDPFTGLTWGLDDPVFAGNTFRRSSFLATSGILPTDQYKQFESWPAARYDKPGGPFDPHTGDPVRLLADRRRLLQEADPRDRGAGGWRVDDVLDVVRHRGRVGPPVRGGAHPRR